MQGIISPPHLATALLYSMLRRWSLYLNRCVDVLASEDLEEPGANTPFSLEPILVDLEGGRYVVLILSVIRVDILAGRRTAGSGGVGGDGRSSGVDGGIGLGGSSTALKSQKFGASRGSTRVRVRYDTHLPALSLQDRENLRTLLVGAFVPTLHSHVLCKNWHL